MELNLSISKRSKIAIIQSSHHKRNCQRKSDKPTTIHTSIIPICRVVHRINFALCRRIVVWIECIYWFIREMLPKFRILFVCVAVDVWIDTLYKYTYTYGHKSCDVNLVLSHRQTILIIKQSFLANNSDNLNTPTNVFIHICIEIVELNWNCSKVAIWKWNESEWYAWNQLALFAFWMNITEYCFF